jgi:hypothetical protein
MFSHFDRVDSVFPCYRMTHTHSTHWSVIQSPCRHPNRIGIESTSWGMSPPPPPQLRRENLRRGGGGFQYCNSGDTATVFSHFSSINSFCKKKELEIDYHVGVFLVKGPSNETTKSFWATYISNKLKFQIRITFVLSQKLLFYAIFFNCPSLSVYKLNK